MTKIKDFIKRREQVNERIKALSALDDFYLRNMGKRVPLYIKKSHVLLLGLSCIILIAIVYYWLVIFSLCVMGINKTSEAVFFSAMLMVVLLYIAMVIFSVRTGDKYRNRGIKLISTSDRSIDKLTNDYAVCQQEIERLSDLLQKYGSLIEQFEAAQEELKAMGAENSSIKVRKKADDLRVEIKLDLVYDLQKPEESETALKVLELLELIAQ